MWMIDLESTAGTKHSDPHLRTRQARRPGNRTDQTPNPAPAADMGALSGRRIVLVDDNPDLVAVCTRLLGTYGVEVVGTCSHHEAFSALWEETADAVVSNLGDDGAGFELIARIRGSEDPQVASVPAVALSGFEHAHVIERAFAAGFDLYLSKPVALQELVRALGSVIRAR